MSERAADAWTTAPVALADLQWSDDTGVEPETPSDTGRAAHLWLARVSEAGTEANRARYESLLSPEESKRYRRFVFEADRIGYLVAHALVRTTLSRYSDTAPQQWAFRANRYGRPEIDPGAGSTTLRFNLSHAHGLVACLVTAAVDCGVDVEGVGPLDDLMQLARTVLARHELEALEALSPERRIARFFEHWTLKESYIKARGIGLSMPLREFGFRFEGARLASFATAAAIDDDPGDWQFSLARLSASHVLAVALRCGQKRNLPVYCRYVVP